MKNCNIKHSTIDQSNLRNIQLKNSPEPRRKIGQRNDRNRRIKFSDQNFSIVSFSFSIYNSDQKSYDEIDTTKYFHENVLTYKHLQTTLH